MLIAVATGKGGEGKTTWACALAQFLGATVLDLDPQQGDAQDWGTRAGHPVETIWPEPFDDLQKRLQAAAKSKDLYVADCPPNEGSSVRLALGCATLVVVPVVPGWPNIRGLYRTMDLIKETRTKVNRKLKAGIVLNANRSRSALGEQVRELLAREHKPEKGVSFLGAVTRRQAVADAWGEAKPVHKIHGPAGEEFSLVLARAKRLLKG